MISPIVKYILEMQSQGKQITQEHINRYLESMERAGKDVSKNRTGGLCSCGKPYVKKTMDDKIGKWEWFVRSCDCED